MIISNTLRTIFAHAEPIVRKTTLDFLRTNHDFIRADRSESGKYLTVFNKNKKALQVRLARLLVGSGLEERDIRKLQELVAAGPGVDVTLVQGADILTAYNYGPASCMKGRDLALDLYAANSSISLAIVGTPSKCMARALVYDGFSSPKRDKKIRAMGRIYAKNMEARTQLTTYGQEKCDAIMQGASLGESKFIFVPLDECKFPCLPYLDNLHRAVEVNGVVYLTNHAGHQSVHNLCTLNSEHFPYGKDYPFRAKQLYSYSAGRWVARPAGTVVTESGAILPPYEKLIECDVCKQKIFHSRTRGVAGYRICGNHDVVIIDGAIHLRSECKQYPCGGHWYKVGGVYEPKKHKLIRCGCGGPSYYACVKRLALFHATCKPKPKPDITEVTDERIPISRNKLKLVVNK